MTTNSTALRDACFARASAVTPAGAPAWGAARKVSLPTLNSTDLPALQVIFVNDRMTPNGDANTGPIEFLVDTTIMIQTIRSFDDPIVLDGHADDDLDAILDALLTDATFSNPPAGSPFYFEGVSSIDNVREAIQNEAEGYLLQASLRLVFQWRCLFSPPALNWLEEVDIAVVGRPGTAARAEVGNIVSVLAGPASGFVGATVTITAALEAGASFTGNQTISFSDGGAGGTFSPASPITPPNGATASAVSYTPAAAGSVSITTTNGQGWPDPAPHRFTATTRPPS